MKRQSQQMGTCGLKSSLKFITKTKQNQQRFLIHFFFCLQNVSELLDQQYNGFLLIQVIKESKENHTFFVIALVLIKQTFFQSCSALSPFSVQTRKENTTKTLSLSTATAKLTLNRENIFCEIKFLICIHKIPFVKLAIFETQFAKLSSLEIFSHENIFS